MRCDPIALMGVKKKTKNNNYRELSENSSKAH